MNLYDDEDEARPPVRYGASAAGNSLAGGEEIDTRMKRGQSVSVSKPNSPRRPGYSQARPAQLVKASNKSQRFSSDTISKDLTGGKVARDAALLRDFGKKNSKNISSWSRTKEGAALAPTKVITDYREMGELGDAKHFNVSDDISDDEPIMSSRGRHSLSIRDPQRDPDPVVRYDQEFVISEGPNGPIAAEKPVIIRTPQEIMAQRQLKAERVAADMGYPHQPRRESIDAGRIVFPEETRTIKTPQDIMAARRLKREQDLADGRRGLASLRRRLGSLRINDNSTKSSLSSRTPRPLQLGTLGASGTYLQRDAVRKFAMEQSYSKTPEI